MAYEKRISDWSSDVCSSDLAFGEAIFVVWVVVVGQMADHAHLQADPVLEEFQRDRCMDRLVEDRLVFAVTERQSFDLAKLVLRRILTAGFRLQLIPGNLDLAHREAIVRAS